MLFVWEKFLAFLRFCLGIFYIVQCRFALIFHFSISGNANVLKSLDLKDLTLPFSCKCLSPQKGEQKWFIFSLSFHLLSAVVPTLLQLWQAEPTSPWKLWPVTNAPSRQVFLIKALEKNVLREHVLFLSYEKLDLPEGRIDRSPLLDSRIERVSLFDQLPTSGKLSFKG